MQRGPPSAMVRTIVACASVRANALPALGGAAGTALGMMEAGQRGSPYATVRSPVLPAHCFAALADDARRRAASASATSSRISSSSGFCPPSLDIVAHAISPADVSSTTRRRDVVGCISNATWGSPAGGVVFTPSESLGDFETAAAGDAHARFVELM